MLNNDIWLNYLCHSYNIIPIFNVRKYRNIFNPICVRYFVYVFLPGVNLYPINVNRKHIV